MSEVGGEAVTSKLAKEVIKANPRAVVNFLKRNASVSLVKRVANQLPLELLLQLYQEVHATQAKAYAELRQFLQKQVKLVTPDKSWTKVVDQLIADRISSAIVFPDSSQQQSKQMEDLRLIIEQLAKWSGVPVEQLVVHPAFNAPPVQWAQSWKTISTKISNLSIDSVEQKVAGSKSTDAPKDNLDIPSMKTKLTAPTGQSLQPQKEHASNQPDSSATDYSTFRKEMQEGIHINNGGLVILAPFFEAFFFRKLGLLEKGQFVDQDHQERAVLLLQYLATGALEMPEQELPFE